jgi:hypothetical protein
MASPRLYIAVTFWGEQYRRYFVDYCLASLMAPGNIPALAGESGSRLLIATTDVDWQAMQSEPVFQAACANFIVEHVVHNVDRSQKSRPQIMQAMSDGHRLLADRMFEDGAYGVFVYPDSLLADGGLARLRELAQSGKKVVMCLAVRFANEHLIGALHERGLLRKGEPLTVDAMTLARLSITHMHSEARRCDFEAEAFDYGAGAYFWTVTPGQNVLFHTGNWAPMLVDYGSLAEHDTSTFARWTLDGDYVHSNFPDPKDFYIVQNTSELFISGFTPESQTSYSLKPFFPYRFGGLRSWLKIRLAHHFLVRRGLFDAVKLEFFRYPIRMQGGDIPEAAWQQVEQRAASIVQRMQGDRRSPFDSLINFGFDRAFRAFKRLKALVRGGDVGGATQPRT